jgi:3-oxoacyl-[acyl-carrier-protein] synthase-1
MSQPRHDSMALTGIGMMTPVGLGAYASCAALRAGIVRIRELDVPQGTEGRAARLSLVGSPIKGLTDGYFGLGRWVRLAVDGLRDLMANARLESEQLSQAGIFIGLPAPVWPGSTPERQQQLAARIAQWLQVPGLMSRIHFYPEGHASALRALEDALTQLRQGRLAMAVVGGLDSLVEPDVLTRLRDMGRLKTDDNPVGFVPGEASAFFLLETPRMAQRRKAGVMAWLDASRLSHEPVTAASGQPCDGQGLGQAITKTFEALEDRGAGTGLIVNDLNGELFRAEEFSKMVPRALRHLRSSWRLWHPADCIGDTGAASVALSVCIGARALVRGYAATDHVLACASSDEGLRGAVYLRSAGKEEEHP